MTLLRSILFRLIYCRNYNRHSISQDGNITFANVSESLSLYDIYTKKRGEDDELCSDDDNKRENPN